MPRFDLPLDELRTFSPAVAEPADFDDFWARTLAEARRHDAPVVRQRWEGPLTACEVFDVRFPGYGAQPIAAWLLLPTGHSGPLPVVVTYQGYGGGRGLPHDHLAWVSAGYAVFVTDTRGQGSSWGSSGSTPDPDGSEPSVPGWMTRGIAHPDTYFYRRVFTDAVRAVDAVRSFPEIDPSRVVVAGGSQGGGIALAVSGLAEVALSLVDVPFLCHFERAIGFTGRDPYSEIVRYLAVHRGAEESVFRTLSYVDGVNFAARATAPALFSVALMDPVCPPSTVFAAHNAFGGAAEIAVYPFNEHEGGGPSHWLRQAEFLARTLPGAA